MAVNRISLAEQLKQISDVAPVDYDPEDAHLINSEVRLDTNSAARDHYTDVSPSSIRELQESVSGPKYSGKRISRSQLTEGSHYDTSEDDQSHDHIADSEDSPPSEEREKSGSRPASRTNTPLHDDDVEPDLASKIRKTREEDRLKGLAVSRQIILWDTLLDARIRLQKAFSTVNRFPTTGQLAASTSRPTAHDALDNMLSEAMLLSDELFLLQEHLAKSNEGIELPSRKRRRIDTPSDHTTWVSEATQSVVEFERIYHPHLIRTLSKWSSKIQSVAPSVLLPSNRNAFSKNTRQEVKNVVQLVDEILRNPNEWDKLVGRTKVWRGKGERIGSAHMQEHDEEVFDDTDFYQQLLRDVIDSRNGEQGGHDWMIVQKEKKRKKNVDTRASKGRKLRYEVHEKIQNFMAPVPVSNGWHEEQVDELFASLLGKGFEAAN